MTDARRSQLELLLDQQRRRLLAAVLLPSEGPLTDAQRRQVWQAVNKHREAHRIGIGDIAKQTGVSTSALQRLFTDAYQGVSLATLDGHLRSLNDWLEADARRRLAAPRTQYVETLVAKRILVAAQHATARGVNIICHGPSGIGKSLVAGVLVEKYPGAIYIRVSRGTRTFERFRSVLATKLRISTRGGPRNRQVGATADERVFERLRGSHRLLVIDEAHRLADATLDWLRDLSDETHVPMVLLCTYELVERIQADAHPERGQLYSRFGYVRDLTAGCDEVPGGSHPLFTHAQIRAMFESDLVRLTPEAGEYLMSMANLLGYGSLRVCRLLMDWAPIVARGLAGVDQTAPVVIDADLLVRLQREVKSDPAFDSMVAEHGTAPVAVAS
jgi:DNA transposition AAA+ family ATPase